MKSRIENYIFVATTGRSGTMSLSKLFANIPRYLALHEPYPDMTGQVVIEANKGNTHYMEHLFLESKLPRIHLDCVKSGAKYYLETSHMFIKTFWRSAIDHFGSRIKIINLVRDPKKVARSIYQVGEIPGTALGNHWFLDYRAPSNHLQISSILDGKPEFRHPYFRCLWYVYEILERVHHLKQAYPKIPLYQMDTRDMNSISGIEGMFEFIGAPYDRHCLINQIGKRYNQMKIRKARCAMPKLSNEDVNLMYEKFIFLLYDLNIDSLTLK